MVCILDKYLLSLLFVATVTEQGCASSDLGAPYGAGRRGRAGHGRFTLCEVGNNQEA